MKKLVIAFIGVVVGLGLMAVGMWLPFVPSWRIAETVIVVAGLASAFAWILGAAIASWRLASSGRRRIFVVGSALVAVLMLLGLTSLLAFVSGTPPFAPEGLVETLEAQDLHRTLFVYSRSEFPDLEFPDGIVASRVTVRKGSQPLERTILKVPGSVAQVRREGPTVLIVFRRAGRARYDLRSGQVEWPDEAK